MSVCMRACGVVGGGVVAKVLFTEDYELKRIQKKLT